MIKYLGRSAAIGPPTGEPGPANRNEFFPTKGHYYRQKYSSAHYHMTSYLHSLFYKHCQAAYSFSCCCVFWCNQSWQKNIWAGKKNLWYVYSFIFLLTSDWYILSSACYSGWYILSSAYHTGWWTKIKLKQDLEDICQSM